MPLLINFGKGFEGEVQDAITVKIGWVRGRQRHTLY